MMKYAVHVPQGFSARLMRDTLEYDIDALFTNGFLMCNIITCIGKDKLVLMHVDPQFPFAKVSEEINWIGEANQTFIFFRQAGKLLLTNLLVYFKEKMPLTTIVLRPIDEVKIDGVFLSFIEQEKAVFHPQIRTTLSHEKPKKLLCHPLSQPIFTVRKIQEVIGLSHSGRSPIGQIKNNVIFDGITWMPVHESDISVDCSDATTKKEMDLFNKEDPLLTLMIKVKTIITKIRSSGFVTDTLSPELEKMCITHTIFCLEDYLNHYDYEMLFKRDLRDLMNFHSPESKEDALYKQQLLQVLHNANNNDTFDKIARIIAEYRQKGHETGFKKNVLGGYEQFVHLYYLRKNFGEMAKANQEKLSQATKLAERAKIEYAHKRYQAAVNLYFDVIKFQTLGGCLASNPDLAIAYYNYGRSLYQTGNFTDAKLFLNVCLRLRENYVHSGISEIEKTRRALEECEDKNIDSKEKILPLAMKG